MVDSFPSYSSFLQLLPVLFLFFFFFNDPAPTEISPLSLHAALPISLDSARIAAERALLLDPDDPALRFRLASLKWKLAETIADPDVHNHERRDAARHFEQTDRKSTRLNSSHDQISYAVFCLKKKKNK